MTDVPAGRIAAITEEIADRLRELSTLEVQAAAIMATKFHWHQCLRCCDAEPCEQECTIEPDLADRGRRFGAHVMCGNCARTMVERLTGVSARDIAGASATTAPVDTAPSHTVIEQIASRLLRAEGYAKHLKDPTAVTLAARYAQDVPWLLRELTERTAERDARALQRIRDPAVSLAVGALLSDGRRLCAHSDLFCDVCLWADGRPFEKYQLKDGD